LNGSTGAADYTGCSAAGAKLQNIGEGIKIMQRKTIAAMLAAVVFSMSTLFSAPQVRAQTSDEKSDNKGDGRGSGCDHEKEDTIS
jgi:hypothetical protein